MIVYSFLIKKLNQINDPFVTTGQLVLADSGNTLYAVKTDSSNKATAEGQ